MTISEKVAYLKGLAEGLDLDKEPSKEGKLIAKVIDILEDVGLAVEDLEAEVEAIGEEVDSLGEDFSDLEDVVYESWDEDEDLPFGGCGSCCSPKDPGFVDPDDLTELDLDELGDDFFEIACPSCGEDIVIDEGVLDIGEVTCPNCGDKFSLDLTDEDPTEE
jgi:hypothetical protein